MHVTLVAECDFFGVGRTRLLKKGQVSGFVNCVDEYPPKILAADAVLRADGK